MKKQDSKRLALGRETIRSLSGAQIADAAGAESDGCGRTYLTQCPTTHPTSVYNMCSGARGCLTETTF